MMLAMVTEWPIVEVIVGIALLLILLDTFVNSELLTHVGIVLLCGAVFWLLDWPLVWRLLAAVAAWFVLVGLYYLLWKQVVSWVANSFVAPTRFKDSVEDLKGAHGRIEHIEGQVLCRVGDGLFPVLGDPPPEGAKVVVSGVESGSLHVQEEI